MEGTSSVQQAKETEGTSSVQQAKETEGVNSIQQAEGASSVEQVKEMEEMTSIQKVKELRETLKHHKKVNLFGPSGAGKTWMAKKISDCINKPTPKQVSAKGSGTTSDFDLTLWVFMCRDYDKKSLSESIGRQLSLLPIPQEWEVEDDGKGQKEEDEVKNSDNLIENLRKKLKEKKILLILDDVLDEQPKRKASNEDLGKVWNEMLPDHKYEELHTILISRSSREDQDIPNEKAVEVKPLPKDESESLLAGKLDTSLRQNESIQTLCKKLTEKSNRLPGTVTIIAKALNYLIGLDKSKASSLNKELEEASENYNVNKLLTRMHDVLPLGVLKDLHWRGRHFFRDSGSVHYNELIMYWIFEGYLGNLDSMTKLYEKGHGVVMELIDCGILKPQEGGHVFLDKSLIDIEDLNQHVDKLPSLGLATVLTSDLEGFGRITYEDGMLKTPRIGKKNDSLEEVGQNLSSLLLDGTHFSQQVMLEFLESEKELQVLGLFNPTIQSFPKVLDMMEKLRVLVVRGCEFLQEVKRPLDDLTPFKSLRVLEISGARSLKSLKSRFFKNMQQLQSLHLSGLQITSLPNAIYSLSKLTWLVIKDCPKLKKLESLAKLEDLKVIDLSGNVSLENVDKNFLKFQKLQILNLSETMVSTTPLLKQIGELTHLLVRDCTNLDRLRGLTSIRSLQTLDISGSTKFEEFHDSSLESLVSLRTLNVSATAIDRLPSNVSNPRYLYLRSCPNLERLSCLESTTALEELDLSGSNQLNEIEDEFFDHMTQLRILNLSETKVPKLPSLKTLSNLRELLLARCSSLVHLPSLESATKLEVLDASDCSVLEDIGTHSFEKMSCLRNLNLSETKIKSLPTLPKSTNLRRLLLKNCTNLSNLELNPSLSNLEELNLSGVASFKGTELIENMNNLRILDLSWTRIEQLPSMVKLTNLTHLSLVGCSSLDTLPELVPLTKLEVLNLSKSSVKHLPNFYDSNNLRKLLLKDCPMGVPDVEFNDLFGSNWISRFSHLEHVEFPNKDIQGAECSSEESNQDQWKICSLPDTNKPPVFLSGTQFLQLLKKNPSKTSRLCATPVETEGETRHELVFGDIYLQTSQFSRYKDKNSLQIRGFDHFPKGIESIISHVELVFLIDNKFENLSSGLASELVSNLNGCWIERCHEMVTIFHEKELPESNLALKDLGISNNRRFKSIYEGKQNRNPPIFNSLKTLYLNGCPEISTVFPSSWLPRTLQVLQIKHCDKIVSLSESENEDELPNLVTLDLYELPELENVRFRFPKLQTLKLMECPKVKQIEDILKSTSFTLKTLWISGAPGLTMLPSSHDFRTLESLLLQSCMMLKVVTTPCRALENVESIKIRSCEKVKRLFDDHVVAGEELKRLNTLHLEDLPMFEDEGVWLPEYMKDVRILECPKWKDEGKFRTKTD